jgi:integrase
MPRQRQDAYLYLRKATGEFVIKYRDETGNRRQLAIGETDRERAEWRLRQFNNQLNSQHEPTIRELLETRQAFMVSMGTPRARDNRYRLKPLLQELGHLKWSEFTRAENARYIAARTADGLKSGGRWELEELQAAFNMAVEDEIIPKAPKVKKLGRHPPRDRYLTPEQFALLMSKVSAPHLILFLTIAGITGQRGVAILDLTWDRVDLVSGGIDFQNPEKVKTKKRRVSIPISPELTAILEAAKAKAKTPYVIELGGRRVESVKQGVKRAGIRAAMPWVSVHVIKHSVISWLAAMGWTMDQIADYTGTNWKTVQRVYRKVEPGDLKGMAADLSSLAGIATNAAIRMPSKQESVSPETGIIPAYQGVWMVGTAGFEPATPTMST